MIEGWPFCTEEYRNLKELDERGAHVAVIGAGFVGAAWP